MRKNDDRSPDNDVDANVRAAYRRLASETAPPALNDAVLAEARAAARPAARGLWQWRRPLAWVTMIGLSLAIVLEINQTGSDIAPVPGGSPPTATAPSAGAVETALPGESIASDRAADTPEGAATTSPRLLDSQRSRAGSLEKSVATQTEAGKRSRDEELEAMSSPAAAPRRENPPSAGTLDEAAVAAGQRLRDDGDRQADLFSSASAGEPAACDEDTRRDPAHWRACIAALLEADRRDDAYAEATLYREAFPGEPQPLPAQ